MSLSRRGFIGTLMASLGALALKPPSSLLWAPTAEETAVVLAPGALVDLDRITLEVLRKLLARLELQDTNLRDDALHISAAENYIERLGSTINVSRTPLILNQQWSVGLADIPRSLDHHGLDPAIVDRTVEAFVRAIHRHGPVLGAGQLPLPPDIEHAFRATDRNGLSVRGLHAIVFNFDTGDVDHLVRFDVLVAQRG